MKPSVAGLAAMILALGVAPLAAEQAGSPQPPGASAPDGSAAAAGGIPGFYDPVAQTFKPLAAPAAATTEFQTDINFKINLHFGASTALDYPTVGCKFSVRYVFAASGVVASGFHSQSASIQFDAQDPAPTQRIFLRFDTDEIAPKLVLNIQCTAYDINNIGHSFQFQKVRTITSPTASIQETVGLTLP